MAGARDGVAIQKEEPLANDVQYVADYYCPEGFFFFNSLSIQARGLQVSLHELYEPLLMP